MAIRILAVVGACYLTSLLGAVTWIALRRLSDWLMYRAWHVDLGDDEA